MLLREEKGNCNKDRAGRKETHQNPVGLKKLGFGSVADGDSNTKGNGGADDLKRRTGDIE